MSTSDAASGERDAEGLRQFRREVFPSELRQIRTRRRVAELPCSESLERCAAAADAASPALAQAPGSRWRALWASLLHPVRAAAGAGEPTAPTTQLELVGLALSGGGIRSATFSLGALQALARHGLLRQVDYLSTVSGGGYIGSCLSSLLNSPGTRADPAAFPLHHEHGVDEPQALKHLRNSGNYLAPGGLFDKIRIPALLLRGIFTNLLVVLPYAVLAAWLTQQLWGRDLESIAHWAAVTGEFPWTEFYRATPWVALCGVLWMLLFPLLQRGFRGKLERRNAYERSFGMVLLALAGVAAFESLPTALACARAWNAPSGAGERHAALTAFVDLIRPIAAAAAASVVPYVFAGRASASVSSWTGKLALFAIGLLGPLMLLFLYLRLSYMIVFERDLYPGAWGCMYAGAALLWAYNRRFVDVNITSLHGFYRDRLSKAYLIHGVQGKLEPNDDQRLSALNREGTQGPYHLINVALNLQGSEDAELRGRSSDFFTLSRDHCGGLRTGFCPTAVMEHADPHLNLGTAMAISGAAAAPNMGTTTIKSLVFIMTMLNIRLGYWLPNPRTARRSLLRRAFIWGVGPGYLLKEFVSRLDEQSWYVNLSDGGHIENLALYELLRRRCKYIIAVDGEADPELTFNGLAKLMRYARIDLQTEIEIDLDDLRKGADGLSRKHCALGKIRYLAEGETGYLLYVKSSVTGQEDECIREYRSRCPGFPHESTLDQFFDEAQFEAYRALGYDAVHPLFRELGGPLPLAAAFESLAARLRPQFPREEQFAQLEQQLGAVEREFRDPQLAEYSYQLYPELAPRAGAPQREAERAADGPAEERFRRVFHVCNLQLQLMENALLALRLDQPRHRNHPLNRGWMNLFRRWAQAPLFLRCWAVSAAAHSAGLESFCEQALELRSEIRWRQGSPQELGAEERRALEEQGVALDGEDDLAMIAELHVAASGSAPIAFPVGVASVRFPDGTPKDGGPSEYRVELVAYAIRSYYRRMRLLERMLPALGPALAGELGGRPRVHVRSEGARVRRHRDFFERLELLP